MKTAYFLTKSGSKVVVDSSTGSAETLNNTSHEIDWMYVAPEDMAIRYIDKDKKEVVLKAEKGDIIIQFYEYSYTKNPIIIVKNGKWKENIANKEAERMKEQIDKELWAKTSNYREKCCECCECGCASC